LRRRFPPHPHLDDAAATLAVCTRRPVSIVAYAESWAVRVDLAHETYVLAVPVAVTAATDPDAPVRWTVSFHAARTGNEEVLSQATHDWLADALELAVDALRGTASWRTADAMHHEYAAPEPELPSR